MNILAKDTRTVYIIPYSESTEVTKTVSGKTIRTGEYTQGYENPFAIKSYVSAPKGLYMVDINGIKMPEQRIMISDYDRDYDTENPVKEADLVLIPAHTLSQSVEDVLELLLDNGELSTFAKNNFTVYRVSNISPYDYHIQFTITRIEV